MVVKVGSDHMLKRLRKTGRKRQATKEVACISPSIGLAVLDFNFLGDGIRDAADLYA